MLSPPARTGPEGRDRAVLAFVYVPLASSPSTRSTRTGPSLAAAAASRSVVVGWPSTAPGPRDAFLTSVKAGIGATAHRPRARHAGLLRPARYDFFGKTAVNLLVILPIALPGIVTGLALSSVFTDVLTPVLGIPACSRSSSATRRSASSSSSTTSSPGCGGMGTSLEAASADLGADALTTFRRVTLPLLSPSLVAGACSPSACPSTRSWSRRSPPARAPRPCRSGSTTTCSGPTRPRSSTSSPSCWSSSRSCRSGSPSG